MSPGSCLSLRSAKQYVAENTHFQTRREIDDASHERLSFISDQRACHIKWRALIYNMIIYAIKQFYNSFKKKKSCNMCKFLISKDLNTCSTIYLENILRYTIMKWKDCFFLINLKCIKVVRLSLHRSPVYIYFFEVKRLGSASP